MDIDLGQSDFEELTIEMWSSLLRFLYQMQPKYPAWKHLYIEKKVLFRSIRLGKKFFLQVNKKPIFSLETFDWKTILSLDILKCQ